jgi:hypothetical protein
MNSTLSEENFIDEEIVIEGLHAEKNISWFDEENHLVLIEIKVYDNNNKLLNKQQKIVIKNADE